jgi:shikimate kinase
MGSGKTTVGRRVAHDLGWEFYDTDLLIEKEAETSIIEIFERDGESAFRAIEENVIFHLLDEGINKSGGSVISLGGGAVTIESVYGRLLHESLVVLLDEDAETAFSRALNGKRPLASDRQAFMRLYAQREDTYRSLARIVVRTPGKSISQVAEEIIDKISKGKEKA